MNEVNFSVLFEDSLTASGKARGLKAKHGLSILVEISKPEVRIMMDTGQSPRILLSNMELLDVSLEKIDAVLVSHGHYDHTGGLLGILKGLKRDAPIIAHPDIFNPKFKLSPNLKYIGSSFTPSELRSYGGVLLSARNSVRIADGVVATGEIERVTPYEKPQGFWTVDNERFKEDTMRDDQALVLDLEHRGLVVVSGCAHAGIINTIKYSQKSMGVKHVHAVIGGFHLKDSKEEIVRKTIDDLTDIDPDFVYPCHCTGSKPIRDLTERFKQRCKPLTTGDRFKVLVN